MFLVELSQNTIKKEIDEVDSRVTRMSNALQQSSAQLQDDYERLMQFIEKDNWLTQEKDKEAETMQNERKKKEKKIKKIDTQIQNLKSDIEKNKDVLAALEEHKNFLVALPFPNLPTWLVE